MSRITKKLGARIRSLRNDMEISQEALAEKANMHWTYLGGIERGERNPTLKNLAKIAKALKIKLSDLFEGVG